ncbi:hypothetical protein ABMX48_36320 [Streptomyces cavourensis]
MGARNAQEQAEEDLARQRIRGEFGGLLLERLASDALAGEVLFCLFLGIACAHEAPEGVALASSLVCFGCFELPCAVLLVLQSVGHLLERQPQLLVALLRLRGLDDGRFVLVFQDIDAVEVLLTVL